MHAILSYVHILNATHIPCRCLYIQIFDNANLQYSTCNISQLCTEKTFEVCATELDLENCCIIVICTYRSPAGNFYNFFSQLDSTSKTEFIICGDLHADFSKNSNFKLLLSS